MSYVGARVELGGLRLYGTDESGCGWTVSSLEGVWDGVESSHAHSSLAWNDGWVSNRARLGGRDITVTGLVTCPDDAAYMHARQALLGAVPVSGARMLVTVDGVTLMYMVQRAEAKPMIQPQAGLKVARYSIPLVSLSPYAFDAGDPLTGSTGLPSSSGGMRFPVVFSGGPPSVSGSGAVPWCFGERVVSGEVSLSNPGGAPSPVSLRVDGPVRDPRVEHLPSGGVLELREGLGAGHFVVFDGVTRQVLVDGRDPARGAVVRRGWSDALPGLNVWRFSAGEYSPGARLSVSFRGAYL